MIVYNELVAVTAGAGLLGFAWFLAHLIGGRRVDSEGWAGFFGVTGLLVMGLHTTLTWPFGGKGFAYANVAFGQPAAGFGALLLFAAVYLWRHRVLFAGEVETANATALAALKPVAHGTHVPVVRWRFRAVTSRRDPVAGRHGRAGASGYQD